MLKFYVKHCVLFRTKMKLSPIVIAIIAGTAAVSVSVVVLCLILIRKQKKSSSSSHATSQNSGSLDLSGEYIPDYYSTLGYIDLWQQGIRGQGVKVLVIDSGVNTNHPDLTDIIPVNFNYEEDVHGTHVTGTW